MNEVNGSIIKADLIKLVNKAPDTLEDPGSSILSYHSQVKMGVFYYVPKKGHIFWQFCQKFLLSFDFCP